MKWSHLLVFASVVFVSAAPAIAQETPRLLFEVTRDGSLFARPEMRVASGRDGRLELNMDHGKERVDFTPTVRGDDIAIVFTITSGSEEFRPGLVITKNVRGSIEWTSNVDGQTLRLTVSRIQ